MAGSIPPWREIVRRAPSQWRRATFGDAFSQREETNNPTLPLLAVTGADGVVDRDTLSRRDTSNPDKSKYLRVCAGDIVYNTMRMWQGVSALVTKEGIVSPAYTVCTPNKDFDSAFAKHLLKFPTLVQAFHANSQGLVDDTLSLKYDNLARLPVTIPPMSEQRKIADILTSVDEAIRLTEGKRLVIHPSAAGWRCGILGG